MPNFAAATDVMQALCRARWVEREVIDQVFRNTPLLSFFYQQKETRPGAPVYEVSVNVEDPTNAYWIEGYDTFTYSPFDSMRSVVFRPRRIVLPTQISDDEIAATEDPDSLMEIIDANLDLLAAALSERLEAAIVQGNPAAKQFPGLDRAVDDGTVDPNYGGLSRVTYPAWRANVDTAAGAPSFTKLLTPLVQSVWGPQAPSVGFTTQSLWISVLNSIMPNERIATPQQDYATGPSRTFLFAGLDVYHSQFIQPGHWYWLNPKSFKFIQVKGRDGVFRGFRIADNQEVYYGRLVWYGTFFLTHCRSNAKLTSLT